MLTRSIVGLGLIVSLAAQSVSAQYAPPLIPIFEFRNAQSDHYFLTGDPEEIAAIEDGRVGPGWGRTGTEMYAYPPQSTYCSSCRPVHRFYRPGNGSHFFTADPVEIARLLGDPSMRHEGPAFIQANAGPLNGSWCVRSQAFFRFYNNRPGDPNHRYVTDTMRKAMRTKGWLEEGAAFCTQGSRLMPLKLVLLDYQGEASRTRVASTDECRTQGGGACLALINIPAGNLELSDSYSRLRVKFSTDGRRPSELASASIYYPLGPEAFRPFHGHSVDTELVFRYDLNLWGGGVSDASSHVYGHPTLEFVDNSSGLPLHFSVLSFGQDLATDFLGRDVASGAVIVGTTHRASSPYLKNDAEESFYVGKSHQPRDPTLFGDFHTFSFGVTREEFRRVLARARELDATLSPDPADYALTAFRYKNEIAGNGMTDAMFALLYSVALYEALR